MVLEMYRKYCTLFICKILLLYNIKVHKYMFTSKVSTNGQQICNVKIILYNYAESMSELRDTTEVNSQVSAAKPPYNSETRHKQLQQYAGNYRNISYSPYSSLRQKLMLYTFMSLKHKPANHIHCLHTGVNPWDAQDHGPDGRRQLGER